LCKMCFPGQRLPIKRRSKSLQRNARRVEFQEEKRRSFLLTFHSTSLLFFASLCCNVRKGRCCTLQRSSTSLLLLHNLNIPPSFKDLVVHTIYIPTYSHCQAVYSVYLTSRSASPPWTSALHPVT
jgi:hypothetical protein